MKRNASRQENVIDTTEDNRKVDTGKKRKMNNVNKSSEACQNVTTEVNTFFKFSIENATQRIDQIRLDNTCVQTCKFVLFFARFI